MYMIIVMSAVRRGSEASISPHDGDVFAAEEPACPGQTAPTQWTEVDHQVLILDTDRSLVYRVPTASVSAELVSAHLQTSTSRRRFIQSLAAGSVAGATIMALPTAAAAASDGDQTNSPAGGGDPNDPDDDLQITGTSGGNAQVIVDFDDKAVS